MSSERFNSGGSDNPFRVPDRYFEELNEHLVSIGDKGSGEEHNTPLRTMIKPLLSLAAVIAAVAVITLAVIQIVPQPAEREADLYYEPTHWLLNEIEIEHIIEAVLSEPEISVRDESTIQEELEQFLINSEITVYEIVFAFTDY